MKKSFFVEGLYIPEIHNHKNRTELLSINSSILSIKENNIRVAQIIASAPTKDREKLLQYFLNQFPQHNFDLLTKLITQAVVARKNKIKPYKTMIEQTYSDNLNSEYFLTRNGIKLHKFTLGVLNSVEFNNERNRTSLLNLILKKSKMNGLNLVLPAEIIASTPQKKREAVQQNFERRLQEELTIKSPTTTKKKLDIAICSAVNNREKLIDDFKVAQGLLLRNETRAAKKQKKQDFAVRNKDKQNFSSTFSPSKTPTIVQGGSPGSKR